MFSSAWQWAKENPNFSGAVSGALICSVVMATVGFTDNKHKDSNTVGIVGVVVLAITMLAVGARIVIGQRNNAMPFLATRQRISNLDQPLLDPVPESA